jgi:hypothetical protein
MAVVVALSAGAFTVATASDAVTHNETAAHADVWECASGLVGWGIPIIGGFFTDGASWAAMGGRLVAGCWCV